MSYNIRPCKSCNVVVECDASNICYECWCIADAADYGSEEE